jgi:chitodextrinase
MKKKWMSGALALLLAGTTVASMTPAVAVNAEGQNTATGTTYYVDSENGNADENATGTSKDDAFKTLKQVNAVNLQPGDQVRFKRGSVFNGEALHFTKEDSGSADASVVISTYGDESAARPQINTNGQGRWNLNYGNPLDNQNHKWKGEVSSCILIEDTEYIEINGLELTNNRATDKVPETDSNGNVRDYNDAYAMDRTGVAGVAKDNGTVDHIVLNDLYIHDVTGNVYNKHMTNGGIYFIMEKPTNEATTGVARYNDVKIKNCYLDTVNRWGIAVGYTYQWGRFTNASLSDEVMSTYGASKVVIENNYLNNVGGDAITTMYCDNPLIQYNVSENAAKQINKTDYSQQQPSLDANGNETGKQDVGAGRVAAGIWPWKCKNAIFQYNECFATLNASSGNGDGQPWDADYGDGTNYQYNYSHGNTASTIMFCGPQSINNTFRYNISQNEDMGPLDPAGNTGNCQVYNNTFYIKAGLNTIWHRSHGNGGPVTAENNIFYFAGSTPATVSNWNPSNNKVFDNNLYYNVSNYPTDANAVKVSAGTAVLVDAGSGPVAAADDKQARLHEDPTATTKFDGYKLAANSPAINAGKVIVDRNGYSIDHDFFGHAITAVPEIGAAESDAVTALVLRSNTYTISGTNVSDLPKNTTVEQFRNNIIVDTGVTVTVKNGDKVLGDADIVKGGATVVLSYEGMEDVTYTVVASSDKELKSSYYMVSGKTLSVPYTTANATTVSELKKNITVADTATVSVLNNGTALADGDAVTAGVTVRITAEDGTTNDYTVAQKNTYNWTLDYAGQQQGNVWFAQQKNGNGDWADMTAYDNTYPNWVLNTYYGVGVDAPNHSTAMSDSIHGLISAPPQTSYSTAMVFRAPKSGTVSFNVKDGEPYLRQAGNSGGTVTLSLLVNDTVKQSVTLSTSNQKAADWANFDEIELNKGDVIRVTASCNSNPSRPSVHVTPIITYVDKAVVDTEAPDAPTAVRTADVTETTAHVAWEAALDNVATTGYNVYVNGEKVNTELVTATEYDLTGLTPATDYSVEIEAVDAAGNVSEKSEAATFTTAKAVDTEAPSVPTDVKASDVTKTGATVTWTASTDNEGVAGYNVYVNGTQVNDTLVATTEYVLTGLTEGTEYTVEVEAVDTNNNVSAKAAATFTTKKDAVNPDPTVVDKTELKATTAKADAALAATDKYTAESLKALQAVYDQYASVLNDENATQAQVDEANKAIAKALNALVEKKTDDGKKDDGNKGDNKKDDTKVDNNKNNPSNTSKSDNKTTTKVDNTKKAAKTGDTTNVAVWAFALAASAAAAGVVVKRKKEN